MERQKGYLIISNSSDEINLSLANEEDYKKALDVIKNTPRNENIDWNKVNECFYEIDNDGNCIKNKFIGEIFTQNGCTETWIFNQYEILGVFHTICW